MRTHLTSSVACLGLWQEPPDAAFEPFLATGYDYWLYRPSPTNVHCRFNYCYCGATDFNCGPAEDGVFSTGIICCCWRRGGRPLELSQFLIFNSAGTGGDEERVIEEATHPDLLGRVSFLWRGIPWPSSTTHFSGYWFLVHSYRWLHMLRHWFPFEMWE